MYTATSDLTNDVRLGAGLSVWLTNGRQREGVDQAVRVFENPVWKMLQLF